MTSEEYGLAEMKTSEKFVSPVGLTISSIFVLIFGYILVMQPFAMVTHLMSPEFLKIIQFFGMLVMCEGLILAIRGAIGNSSVTAQQVFKYLSAVVSLASLIGLIALYNNPSIIPFIWMPESTGQFVSAEWSIAMRYLQLIVLGIVIITILDAVSDGYGAGKLEKYK